MAFRYLILVFLFFGCTKNSQTAENVDTPPSFPCVNVKDCGAKGDGTADENIAFGKAMDIADSANLPIYIPRGIYKTHLKLTHDKLHLIGEASPSEGFNDGTVILGLVDCNLKTNVTVEKIGIDSRGQLSASDDAALTSGAVGSNGILNQRFSDINIIGDGYLNYKHGVLCFAGTHIDIKNIRVSYFYHGIAIRSSHVTVDSVFANYCGFTSVVVKSDLGANILTEDVSVNNVWIKGDPSDPYKRGGAVMVNSYSPPSITRDVRIQNVVSINGGVACVLVQQTNGAISDISISDCSSNGQGDDPSRACYDIDGGSFVTLKNCSALNSTGFGFRARGQINSIKVIGSLEANSNSGSWTGPFSYLQLNGIEIIK